MNRLAILVLAAILMLPLAPGAQAMTIDDPNNGEMHLYEIFADPLFGGGVYASSQAIAEAVPVLESLPAGLQHITVSAYAKFAAFNQKPGAYGTDNPDGRLYLSPLFTLAFLRNANGIFSIAYWPEELSSVAEFGLFDATSRGGIKYTQLALNDGGSLGQSNGLIFEISPEHWIVAFEDGGGPNSLGDMDYNDLVLNVTAMPVPPSVLLLGSGLLGLMLAARRRILG